MLRIYLHEGLPSRRTSTETAALISKVEFGNEVLRISLKPENRNLIGRRLGNELKKIPCSIWKAFGRQMRKKKYEIEGTSEMQSKIL